MDSDHADRGGVRAGPRIRSRVRREICGTSATVAVSSSHLLALNSVISIGPFAVDLFWCLVYSVHMNGQRERILACACELYLKVGLDGFSMRKLARDLGVTAPSIYRHFEGREEVLGEVLREAHRTFSGYLYAALNEPTPLDRFIGAGEGYLNFVVEHPRWYSIMHTGIDHLGMDALPADIEGMQAGIHQFWMDRVRECIQAGILKDGDPELISVTMSAHAHGMVQLYHEGCFPGTEAEFRLLFKQSGTRMMVGVATDDFAVQLNQIVFDEATQLQD